MSAALAPCQVRLREVGSIGPAFWVWFSGRTETSSSEIAVGPLQDLKTTMGPLQDLKTATGPLQDQGM